MGTLDLRGCNLAGGDSPWTTWSNGEIAAWNYKFVSKTDVDTIMAAGANSFRLLFTWEALQPQIYGNVTNNPVPAHKAYADELWSLVDYITSKGARVILDAHGGADIGFAAYYNKKVGTNYTDSSGKTEPVSFLLENLWWQIATKYKANDKVMYGITNEPHDMDAATWFACAQTVITSIRNTGAKGTIWCPGVDWTGAGTWMTHNAAAWNLKDPLGNLGVQLHLYFDANSGGGADDVVSPTIGVERCQAVTTWARSKGLRLWLGEVALKASAPNGPAAWANLVAFLKANSDVWSGFAWWGGGPPAWWSGYRFAVLSGTTTPSPQLTLVSPSWKDAVVTPPGPDPRDAQIAALTAQVADLSAKASDLKAMVTNLQAKMATARAALA